MHEAPDLMTAVTVIIEATDDSAMAPAAMPPGTGKFRKGDLVVYPTHGVGKVDRIGFEEIAGQRLHLIHVSFAENQMTLRIPVIKAMAIGLRRPNTREALQEVLTVLAGRSRTSKIVWVKRAQDYVAG
jgi:CarD family transcriptional regulator